MKRRNPALLSELASAVAMGTAIAAWAKDKGLSERSAYAWAALPEVKAEVRAIRARLCDEAVGRLILNAKAAVHVIAKLLQSESEQIRLAAARSCLDALVQLEEFATFRAELNELRSKVEHWQQGGSGEAA